MQDNDPWVLIQIKTGSRSIATWSSCVNRSVAGCRLKAGNSAWSRPREFPLEEAPPRRPRSMERGAGPSRRRAGASAGVGRVINHSGALPLSHRSSIMILIQIKPGPPGSPVVERQRRRHPVWASNVETTRPIGLAIALMVALTATGSRAQVLSPFRYEDQAQRHCPADTVVWLDFRKPKYYFSSQKLYGSGLHGSFVCLQEARRNLYRRSLVGLR